jgi:hypothetical protein
MYVTHAGLVVAAELLAAGALRTADKLSRLLAWCCAAVLFLTLLIVLLKSLSYVRSPCLVMLRAVACAVQPRFRSLWERYCRGVQAIVYVVDAADHDAIQVGLRQQQRQWQQQQQRRRQSGVAAASFA